MVTPAPDLFAAVVFTAAFTAGVPMLVAIFKSKKFNIAVMLASSAVIGWCMFWSVFWVLAVGHNNFSTFLYFGIRDNNFLGIGSATIILAITASIHRRMGAKPAPQPPAPVQTSMQEVIMPSNDMPRGNINLVISISQDQLIDVFASAMKSIQQEKQGQTPQLPDLHVETETEKSHPEEADEETPFVRHSPKKRRQFLL